MTMLFCVNTVHIGSTLYICDGMSEDKYKAIAASGEQTHWFCHECNDRALDTIRFIQTVKEENEKFRADLQQMKTDISDISRKFEENTKKTQTVLLSKPSSKEVDDMIGERLSEINSTEGTLAAGSVSIDKVKQVVQEQTDEIREQEQEQSYCFQHARAKH